MLMKLCPLVIYDLPLKPKCGVFLSPNSLSQNLRIDLSTKRLMEAKFIEISQSWIGAAGIPRADQCPEIPFHVTVRY